MTTTIHNYPFTMRPLTEDEGGGILIEFPDLPGCASDGETVEEAIENGAEAVESWIECAKSRGNPIPGPYSYSDATNYSGTLSSRVPKTIHMMLAQKAKAENVSINKLVLSYIAQGLGYPRNDARK